MFTEQDVKEMLENYEKNKDKIRKEYEADEKEEQADTYETTLPSDWDNPKWADRWEEWEIDNPENIKRWKEEHPGWENGEYDDSEKDSIAKWKPKQ